MPRLRSQSRLQSLQGRVYYGSALSGRDLNAVNRTVDGLLKLLYPDTETPVTWLRRFDPFGPVKLMTSAVVKVPGLISSSNVKLI